MHFTIMARPVLRDTLFLLGLLICIAGVRTVEVDDEEQFSYIKGDSRGPEHWGDLVDEWAICGNGRQQSPIALVKSQAVISPDLGELQRIYHPGKAILENRGHDIRVRWPRGGGSLVINGRNYILKQTRWHSPAEHSVDGIIYPLEFQMEHQTEDNSSAVVSMLYSYGKPNTFLTKISTASEEQVKALQNAIHDEYKLNARPVQPTNGRIVKIYIP
ncbi:alpha carbonic anhydrase 7 isoform X2 [Cryptomeria japonica]|uniref:alpha carbonic anhydrase 7 isoform X2 n=1 Tax=Cryptomeria japonica TaxID=3369 RepID=UPI0027DA4902|nr:alpha carbonic anhydrase 7 isoform X2 [Cryptomeria japonica]